MIVFGKIVGSIFSSDEYHVFRFRVAGGKVYAAIYRGDNPPPVRRTVQVEVRGRWERHKTYGKQLFIEEWERSEVKEVDYNQARARRQS